MSKRSYEGSPHNATSGWRVLGNDEDGWYVGVPSPCDCDCPNCTAQIWRPHTNGMKFESWDDADAWIEAVQEDLDRDYEDYYEENHYAIVQMERYEAWRNEY